MHTHPFWEFFFCKNKSIMVQTTNRLFEIPPEYIAIIPPNVAHYKLLSPPDTIWSSICFSFSYLRNNQKSTISLFTPINSLLSSNELLILRNNNADLKRIDILFDTLHEGNAETLSLDILALIFSLAKNQVSKTHPVSAPHMLSDLSRISFLESLVMSKYFMDLKAADIANQLFVSVRQLDRIMVKRFGSPFRRVIIDRRLSVAAELLINTPKTIAEISDATGFKSMQAFRKAFIKKYGCPPSFYKKNYLKTL